MDLRELVTMIRVRWVAVVALIVVGTAAGLAIAEVSTEEFTATSTSFVATNRSLGGETGTLYQGSLFALQRVVSYRELVTTDSVLVPVIKQFHLHMSAASLRSEVSVNNPQGTVLLSISVTGTRAPQTADLSNAIARRFGAAVESLEADRAGGTSPVSIVLIRQATVPTSPTSPRRTIEVILGFLAGLVVALAWAIGRERLSDSVRSVEDLDRVSGVSCIGALATADGGKRSLVLLDGGRGAADEYRAARERLQLRTGGGPPRSLVVAADSSSGAPAPAVNLAIAFAQAGRSVCLVDADLRGQSVASLLSLPQGPGLSEILQGRIDSTSALTSWRDGLLAVLAVGHPVVDPAGLLNSAALSDVLGTLTSRFEVVVLSAAPFTNPDAAIVARRAQATLFVARVGATSRSTVAAAVADLHSVQACLVGTLAVGGPGVRRRKAQRSASDAAKGSAPKHQTAVS